MMQEAVEFHLQGLREDLGTTGEYQSRPTLRFEVASRAQASQAS